MTPPIHASSATSPTRARALDWALFVLVIAIIFPIYKQAPVTQLSDAKYSTVVSHYLLENGSLELPSTFFDTRAWKRRGQIQKQGDRFYYYFSDAPSILNAPLVAAYESRGIVPVTPAGRYARRAEVRILRVAAALQTAVACGFLFLLARVWLPRSGALALVAVFAFGTPLFSTVSRAYWSHAWAVLLLSISLWLVLNPRFSSRRGGFVLAATLLSWGYFCRPPLSLAVVAVTLLVAFEHRRHLVAFVTTGAIWAAAFTTYSLVVFSSPLPPYFFSTHIELGRYSFDGLPARYAEGVFGTLVSPGRGLFIYVPFFLVTLWTISSLWRRLPDRRLAAVALAVLVAHWQMVSLFRNWSGGGSFGPRLLADLLPWFFVLTAMAVVALREAPWWRSTGRRALYVTLVAVTVAASLFVHYRGAHERATMNQGSRWDWRAAPFLAGLRGR